jgi:predicted transcriptional regulator YdeE
MYLETFPESEYFVVTHEWVNSPDQADEQIGRIVGAAHDNTIPIPEGYEKYTNPVMFIERYNYSENGKSRFEVWLAIRRK